MRDRAVLRIAVGGIAQETDTFSSLPTRLADFRVSVGDELVRGLGLSVPPDVELVPTLHAGAMPGGLVDREAYLQLKWDLVGRLRAAGPVDGVYLPLHGAMEVAGLAAKPEADLLRSVREVVGPNALVAVSLDLHANVTADMVEQASIFTVYRTAPHRDAMETRQRALDLLVRCLRGAIHPVAALVKPPFLLSGEKAITDAEPLASLMRLARDAEREPGVLAAYLLMGHVWADVPHATVGAIAVADGDAALARRQAARLAGALWEARTRLDFDVETGTMDECLDRALAAPEPTVFITDSGDNPTAGAPGDTPVLLERLLTRHVPDAVFAAIPDRVAVERCRSAGLGATVAVSLGGKLDHVTAPPLSVAGTVAFLSPTGPGEDDLAVLRIGGVDVIVTAARQAFTTPAAFRTAGIDPLRHKIVVAKQGYLFAELRAIAPRKMMALSPGQTDQVLDRLPYRNVPRSVYPVDRNAIWKPEA